MINNIKIELFESINILLALAQKGSYTLPNEICRFIQTEMNLKSVFLAEDVKQNSFSIVGSSGSIIESLKNGFKINEYDKFLETSQYEDNLVYDCEISELSKDLLFQNILVFLSDEKKIVLSLQHKNIIANEDKNKVLDLARFIQYTLRVWNKSEKVEKASLGINAVNFLEKSNKGQVKDIKTINGLITLLKEENISNGVKKYIDEIKSINNLMLAGANDFSKLLNLSSSSKDVSQNSEIQLNEVLKRISGKCSKSYENLEIKIVNNIDSTIKIKESILNSIVSESIEFMAAVSKNNIVELSSKIGINGNLLLNFSTDSIPINNDKLSSLFEPFANREIVPGISGFSLTLLTERIKLLKGNIKFEQAEKNLFLKVSIPVNIENSNKQIEDKTDNVKNSKDKILVIESDSSTTSLLKNYLSKWNYSMEIVKTGEKALSLITKNKYVAVILNIEQENENSLEILQKIKNNNATRNIPVIVFSVEPKKEKIYLMGSVDYLVKPINYNKLVEILTSYKLRRNSTVLCVDDDLPTLNLVKQAVNTAGFNVIAEHRPELVIDLIKDKELDLAIIDLDMPKLNGFDLIKQIKNLENFSKLPIIIYTGKEDYQEDLEKIDGLFVDLLDKKSTSFIELEDAITAMIKTYEEPTAASEIVEKSTGPRILMAEDYKHSQIIVTRLLKKSGFENIVVVENGKEALNICENDKMDLILMDMQMPVMNGFEATGKIRELPGYADTPIIALTAFAMKGDREKCLEAGATDYIPKPIDSKEFIEKVKYYTQLEVRN